MGSQAGTEDAGGRPECAETLAETPAGSSSAPPAVPFDALVQAAADAKRADDAERTPSTILSRYETVARTIRDEDAHHLFAALVFLSTRDNSKPSSR